MRKEKEKSCVQTLVCHFRISTSLILRLINLVTLVRTFLLAELSTRELQDL